MCVQVGGNQICTDTKGLLYVTSRFNTLRTVRLHLDKQEDRFASSFYLLGQGRLKPSSGIRWCVQPLHPSEYLWM